MRRKRNAKIVATLGPATSDASMIRALFERGVDVFRLNFSHGTQSDHAQRLQAIRALEREFERPIGVLLDLQGPKLRLGTFADGPVKLVEGAAFRLDLDRGRRDDTDPQISHGLFDRPSTVRDRLSRGIQRLPVPWPVDAGHC